jgi:hypothetical protein
MRIIGHNLSVALTLVAAAALHAQNAANFSAPGKTLVDATLPLPADCADFRGRTLSVEGRAFAVAAASRREPTSGAPAYCLLEIRSPPALRVDLALPMRWNGRLYMNGNGGYAGEAVDSPMRDGARGAALAQGFAVVGTNTGHDAPADPLGAFAHDSDKLLDYAHRAVHQSALVAKTLLKQIYGVDPRYAYFDGCSTGGREALMAAQRYPEDFNGIIAGAPVFDFTGSQLWGVRTAQLLQGADVGARELKIVGAAVLQACDAEDGVTDGLISDPLHCHFDVRRDTALCRAGDVKERACLSDKQQAALAAVYAPASIGAGQTFPGQLYGAEPSGVVFPGMPPANGWEGWYYPANVGLFAGAPSGVRATFGETFLRDILGVAATWQDFDYSDQSLAGLPAIARLMNATDPDLRPFNHQGGKLLMYFGLADAALNPARLVSYFEQLRQHLGPSTVDRFARLYLVPGMFHCSGGYGPDRFDLMSRLIDWVEAGKAPGTIEATQLEADKSMKVKRTRPLCPYPAIARYRGRGDPSSAASFRCQQPGH